MTMSLWTINGNVIVDAGGVPIVCDHCPCTGASACDLQEAIKERQYAADMTSPWFSGNPTYVENLIATCDQKDDYTLDQLKAYVNHIAPSFTGNPYNGYRWGANMLSSSYADSATDIAELYALVCAMLTTRRLGVEVIDSGERWRGSGSPEPAEEWSVCKNACQGDYGYYSASSGVRGQSNLTFDGSYKSASVDVRNAAIELETPLVNGSLISHAGALYGWGEPLYYPFSSFQYGFVEGYQKLAEYPAGTWNDFQSNVIPDSLPFPTPWPPEPEANASSARDFHITYFTWGITWDFEHK